MNWASRGRESAYTSTSSVGEPVINRAKNITEKYLERERERERQRETREKDQIRY